uniref:NADH-ubiquinone oxidoreductase chain 2 n=1 Tax=Ornithodoros waterbergensis TaxID=1580575 RepID=A0A1P8AGH4_9ACAR|nr:NADH dehydrogenase subunit 2 [Ornithodoros waterbergensis]AIZ58601.1 NADH dehydrogenase subunit 2 [Ornithodoros waterbergensis]AMX74164.1 NADH dehydrogenase subunit 2 [Ornithodoros waterbergensis]UYL27158.1 NADH dehydrogenase subunit 2 [Ornithodoros waterbergensis]
MKIYYFILIWFLVITMIMAVSTSSMFLIWLSMEMNMMSFIPLISTKKSMLSINSTILYFIPQAFASIIFIFFVLLQMLNSMFMKHFYLIILSSMILKLGAAPFHSWFPQASEGMTYSSLFLLISIQKIIPLHMLTLFQNWMILFPMIFSAMIGSMGGLNQSSMRKILAYSSITHLSWMMTLIMFSSTTWLIYILAYSMILFFIIQFNKQLNLNHFNQINFLSKKNSLFMVISLLTLGGLPPMLGFFMKWITLKIAINNMIILTLPLITSSLINLYFYTRLLYPHFMKMQLSKKWTLKELNKIWFFIFMNFLGIIIIIPLT